MEESVKKTEAAIEAVLFSMGDAVELKDRSDVLQMDTKTLQKILDDLAYGDKYGEVLRAKGMVPREEKGVWLHFDMVPEQAEIREGAPDFTGKVCVIGAELDEEGLMAAFNA